MPGAVDFGTYAFTLACPAVEISVESESAGAGAAEAVSGPGSHSAVAQHQLQKAMPSGGIDCHLHHQQQRQALSLKDLASSGNQGESLPGDAGGVVKVLDLDHLLEPPGGIPETCKAEDTGVQLRRSAASALLVLAAGKRTADDGPGAQTISGSISCSGSSASVIHGLPPSEAGENQDAKRARANHPDCNPTPTDKEKERRFAVARRAREGRIWWDDMCDVLREDCEKRGLNSDKHLQYQIANFRPMAQSECIMRFLHVSRADGHIREMEMSQSKESALGWLSLQVEPLRATEFYDGLLRMFNIEPAGGMSCTGVPGRGLLGRQAKTLLTALTRFGLKPDARGGGKWEKGYRGDVPFIYQEYKGT